jgi:hypothetical protein
LEKNKEEWMAKYYFLAISLPPLKIGIKPEISFEEFITRLQVNLSPSDWKKVLKLRMLVDLLNIRALLSGQKLDPRGNYSEKELDEMLLLKEGFPQYVFDFLDQFETNAAKLRHFGGLLATFFREEMQTAEGFLKWYFTFEWEYRLVLSAMRAKMYGRDFDEVLQFEDLNEPFVMQILVQKDMERYEPPMEFAELKELFASSGGDPWEQHKAFTEWKYARMEEIGSWDPFSIDAILSYMVRLLLVEDWQSLDEQQGREALETIVS